MVLRPLCVESRQDLGGGRALAVGVRLGAAGRSPCRGYVGRELGRALDVSGGGVQARKGALQRGAALGYRAPQPLRAAPDHLQARIGRDITPKSAGREDKQRDSFSTNSVDLARDLEIRNIIQHIFRGRRWLLQSAPA